MFLLFLSLGLHAWTLFTLYQVRTMAHEQVSNLAEQIRLAQEEIITIELPISQNIPIYADIPIEETFIVPVDTTVSIQKEVTVRVAGQPFAVPLDMDIPINATVPVNINETIPVSTTVAFNTNIPIAIPLRETRVHDYLEQLHRTLTDIEDDL